MTEAFEPNDYFEELKSKLTEMELSTLEKSREFLAKEIVKANSLGQKNLVHKSTFMWEVLEKELVLHAVDIRQYAHRGDVIRLIDEVRPKNSVKIVELENYPRAIPDENAAAIEKAQNLNLFDVLLVIYTDLENEEVNTPAQKDFVKRNTDPVVFGMFVNDKISVKFDRLYFITDWEDEHCGLTFTKMITKMTELGISDSEKTLAIDIEAINSIVETSKQEIVKAADLKTSAGFAVVTKPPKLSLYQIVMNRIFGNDTGKR